MPRKKKRRSKAKPEAIYTLIAVCVERYDVQAQAGINFLLERPDLAFRDVDEDPVFEHTTSLVVSGRATYPAERAGEVFELTLRGDDSPSSRIKTKLSDMHLRDESRVPQYREYRGQSYPIYRQVPGIASMSRAGKESPWTAWVTLEPRLVSDMLVLLGTGVRLYLSIHERRQGRDRWICTLSLQTTDPAEE